MEAKADSKKIQWSIKVPLILLMLIIGVAPALILCIALSSSMRQGQIDYRISEVQNQSQILSNKMTRAGYLLNIPRDTMIDNEMGSMADIFGGRIVVVDRDYKIVRDTFSLSDGKTNVSEEVIKCFAGDNSSIYNKDKHFFILTIPIYDNTPEKRIDGVMLVTSSTESILALTESVMDKMNFAQFMVFWVVLLAGVLGIKLLMNPFKRLQDMLERVANGELDTDINVDSYTETKQISSAVDRTLTRLKEVDRSREEFVSNVSHELKTPITSIRVLADSLMGMEEVPVELYREFMTDISDEIDRESKIIDDLLTLVRMDKSSDEVNISQVNINALLELILKRLRPIAKKRNIEIVLESIREVTADVDEVKFSLALNNLVENAIKYNYESGWVRVTLDADHKFFYVKVMDSGVGIPEEFQTRVFERFYRVDKARSRETGGTGLGLAITKNVVIMHHGALKLQSKEGEGTTFTVRIPLTYIS